MIAENDLTPYIPRFDTENVPPCTTTRETQVCVFVCVCVCVFVRVCVCVCVSHRVLLWHQLALLRPLRHVPNAWDTRVPRQTSHITASVSAPHQNKKCARSHTGGYSAEALRVSVTHDGRDEPIGHGDCVPRGVTHHVKLTSHMPRAVTPSPGCHDMSHAEGQIDHGTHITTTDTCKTLLRGVSN